MVRKNPTILIVDDREADLFTALLQEQGFEVHGESSVKEALKWLRTNTPDVILTDLALPVLSGLDFLEKLNQDDFRIAVLSGHFVNGMVERMLKEMGVEKIFEKGTKPEKVIREIVDWLK